MPKKTIRVATWEYYAGKGKKRRRAYYGDVVDLSAAEIKRGEAAGVFGTYDTPPEPAAPAPVPAGAGNEPPTDDADGDEPPTGDGDGVDGGDDLDGMEDDPDADGTTDTADGDADAVAEPVRPKNTALTADWVDYAVAKGLDRAEAEAMDRTELIKALS